MAQFRIDNQKFLPQEKTLFEVNQLATPDGNVVSSINPLPVTLGNSVIQITSNNVNVTVPNTISVNSSSNNPVHVHLTEIGTSNTLNVPYMPIDGNVTVNNVVTVTGLVDINNAVGISGTVKIGEKLTPAGTAVDAFGRLRISTPFTLFDSQNRYSINEKFNSSNTGTANANVYYVLSESSVLLNVGTASNDMVKRETKRVFAYQPGKSLLVLNTFAMANAQNNLTQRVGYFNDDNGVYLEKSNNNVYLVLRSNSSGTISESRVLQANWSQDPFDGTTANSYSAGFDHGPLNTSNTNIFWADIEWLGVGDVRCGFVVDGVMLPAHIFHNDNIRSYAYMTTACLPVRYEIFNTGPTVKNSTMRQICSTVISEGGYQLQGRSRSIGHNINAAATLSTAGVDYTVLSLRLKSERPDAIVLPKSVSILGISTNPTRLKYKIVTDANTSGGTWTDFDTANSAVQYNLGISNDGTDGVTLTSGYIPVTNQSTSTVNLVDDIFKYQLERNNFTGTNSTFNIVVSGATNGDKVVAALDWEEVV